ncbi:hypothetical protein ABPG74_019998 [Tetrahymena malaccensis]
MRNINKILVAMLFYFSVKTQEINLKYCQNKGQYYNSQLSFCYQCSPDCQQCFDGQNCLLCQESQYQQFQGTGCSGSCQIGFFESNYFRQCKQCKVNNCQICNDAQICLKCKQGWILDEQTNSCQNTKCIIDEGAYYYEETDSCKYYCNEGSDENSMQCIKFKKLGDQDAEMLRMEIEQDNILQMQIIEIEDQKTVIALDLQKAIYYKYPELIPYLEIVYNQTAYFTYQRGTYILIIYSDQSKFARINVQTKKIDYYQIGYCDNPQVYQHFLICGQIQLNAFTIIDLDNLDNPLFQPFQFQPKVKSFQELQISDDSLRQIDNESAIIDKQSKKEIQSESAYEINSKNRNLQDLPQNQDKLGCYINQPKQFDVQPKQMNDVLRNRTIQLIQGNSSIEYFKQNYNIFILEEISMLLYFDKQSQILYSLDSKNLQNSNKMLIQFTNTRQILCSYHFKNTIHLLFLTNQSNMKGVYYLTSTFDSGYYQFNQSDNCSFLPQSQTLLLQGKNGYSRIKTSDPQDISKNSIFYKNEYIISNTNNYVFSFYQNQEYYAIKMYDDQVFDIKNQITLSIQQYYFSLSPSKFTFLYDDLEKSIVLSNRNEIQLIRISPKQDQAFQIFSRNTGGKIRQNFGQIITIFNLEIDEGMCIIYEQGFNIIFEKQAKSSIARYLDFKIDIQDFKDNYLILGSNLQKQMVIFDIYLQVFKELNFESSQFKQLFIVKSTEFIVITISLTNDTFNLYTLNRQQGINGYHFNYNLLISRNTQTVQYINNQLYLVSDKETVLVYQLEQNQITLISSFYYSQFFQIVNQSKIFQFSRCKENLDTYLTVFNILIQETHFILFKVDDLSYQKLQVYNYIFFQRILFQTGRYNVKIYDMTKQSFLDQTPKTDLTNSVLIDKYIIYQMNQYCYIFNIQTLEQAQMSFPTYVNLNNYFIIDSQSYFLVYFPDLEKSLIFNVNNQQFQQAVQMNQNSDTKYLIQNKEIVIYENQKTQKILQPYSLVFRIDSLEFPFFTLINNKLVGLSYSQNFLQILDLNSKSLQQIDPQFQIYFWFWFNQQYYFITKNSTGGVLYNQELEVIKYLGDSQYYSFDQQSNILVCMIPSTNTLNFYLLNSDVELKAQIQKYDYVPKFTFYNFQDYSLVLVTMSAKEAFFINYEQGTVFEFKNGDQKIKFKDGLFVQDKYIITFEYQIINKFEIIERGVKLIKQYQASIEFLDIYNKNNNQLTFYYHFQSNQLILIHLQKYIMSFDLDTFTSVCQQQLQQVLGFVYFQKQNIVISLKPSSFTILNLNSCSVRQQNLMSISFIAQTQFKIQYEQSIFILEAQDLLIFVSTNGLEIYQFTTLNYLITNNYKYENQYQQIQAFIIEDSNEIILTTTNNQIQVYDLTTTLFYNPTYLDTSFENNFVFFEELNIISQLNQNSGVFEIKDAKEQNLIQQIKLKMPYSVSKYSVYFQRASLHKIIVFVSQSEYHTIDVQNYNYTVYQIPFRCLKLKDQNFNIFCLNELSQIYKFNQITFKFDLVYNQITSSSIIDIQILSDDFLMMQQSSSSFIVFQLSSQKYSQDIQLISNPIKIAMVNNLIGVQTRQKIQIYYIGSSDSQYLMTREVQQYEDSKYIQSFLIIKTIRSYQLIYSTQEATFIYDILENQEIATMKNAAQYKQQIFIDNRFIYLSGIANFILYDIITLQRIIYYSVNQFLYSSIQKIIHIDEDYFILILQQQIIITKINLKRNDLIHTFSNLTCATIHSIEKIYNTKSKLSAVNIYGHTDTNLFKLNVNKLDQNFNSKEVSLEVLQNETQLQVQQLHYQEQTEVYKQGKVVGLYILSFEKQQQQIFEIPIYYTQIFTNFTMLQIQSSSRKTDNNAVSLVIQENIFSYLKFTRILFYNIELYIQPNLSQFILNPQKRTQKIIFDKVYLKFFNETQSLVINDCKQLIWQEVVIQNQNLRRKYAPIYIQNVEQIKIDGLLVDHLITSSFYDSIHFINVTNIEIIINNTFITRGSMFYFEKVDMLNITKLNAQFDTEFDIIPQDIYEQDQQENISQNDLKVYLFTLKGCFTNYFSNFQIDSPVQTGILMSYNSLEDLKNPSFTYQILMKNISIYNSVFKQDYQLFDLVGYIIQFDNLQIIDSSFFMDSISIQASQQAVILNSNFTGINLFKGSIFALQGPDLLFENVIFQNISSQSTAAIYCFQSNTLKILQSKFIDITCQSVNPLEKCMGGSLNLQQIDSLYVNSYFDNSFSNYHGGAIYINNQNQFLTEIQSSIFNNCKAKNGSGGALYIQQSQNVNIYNTTFLNNTAHLERGGAIALYYSNLVNLANSKFIHNQAQIGGGIWYGPYNQTFKNDFLQMINNKFQENEGFFYGQDIGSSPQYIQRVTKDFKQIQNNQLENIQSGNLIDQDVYFIFFDEQNKPFNFTNSEQHLSSLEVQNERQSYFMKVSSDYNPSIIIKLGQNLEKLNQLGLFKLQISTSYQYNKQQKILIKSNPLINQRELFYNLTLQFRDCLRGEIQLSQNDFIECNQCQEGKYSLAEPSEYNMNELICQPCPIQAVKCFKDVIILKDGYWRENNLTDQIYTCHSNGCSETQLGVKDRCLEGYIGPLCDSCDTSKQVWGDYYGKKDSYCFKCKEIKYQYIYFSAILIFYTIYLVICIGDLIEQKIFIIKLLLFKQIDLLITSKSSSQGETVTLWIKIFIHYIQITSLIFSFEIKYPQELSVPVKIFGDPASLTVTSLDCLTPTSENYPFWIHRLVVQIINLIIQYIAVMILYYLFYLRGSYHTNLIKKLWTTGLKTGFVFFYLFYQPSIAKLILSGYFCRQIGEKYYLIQDLNQQCFTNNHITLVLSLITPLCLLWCFLIPLYVNSQLKKIKQYVDKIKNIQQMIVYSLFYQGYKTKCFDWEIVKIYQKFILMIVINSNFSDIIKIALIIVVLLLYTIYLTVKKPHRNIKLMNCEKIMVAILNFNFLFLLLILNESDPSRAVLIMGYILIIICNIIALSSFVMLLSNSLVIRLNDENSTSTKIKKLLYRLWRSFPKALQFIKFRKVNQYKTHKYWRHVKTYIYKQSESGLESSINAKLVNYKKNQKAVISTLNNIQSERVDQDQQNFIFQSEQIDEKAENIVSKYNETTYRGGGLGTKNLTFKDCASQGQYYNTQLSTCEECSKNCQSCLDEEKCLFCSTTSYQQLYDSTCVSSCQTGLFESKYLRECKQCKISDCLICKDAFTCEQCKEGWILNNQGSACLNMNCRSSEETYYEEVISIDNERIIYYKYPDLTPYFEISYNQSAYFIHTRSNFIFIIFDDKTSLARINYETTNIDYYQLDNCEYPTAQQNYLICGQINQITYNIVDLDKSQIQISQFQIKNRILNLNLDSKQYIQQTSNNVDVISRRYSKQLNEINYEKDDDDKKKKKLRNLQNFPQNIDDFGCNSYVPKQFDQQPYQINYMQKVNISNSLEQSNNLDNQQVQIYVLNEINILLFYDKRYQNLYAIDPNNLNRLDLVVQFKNVSNVICAYLYNNNIQLVISQQSNQQILYYLSSTLVEGKYTFNQSEQNQVSKEDVYLNEKIVDSNDQYVFTFKNDQINLSFQMYKHGVIVILFDAYSYTALSLNNCFAQSIQFMGIHFSVSRSNETAQYNQNIILIDSSDLIIFISTDGLEVYQFSTLNYLLTYNYLYNNNNQNQIQAFIIQESNEIIFSTTEGSFVIYDLSTTLFYNPNEIDLSTESNFVIFTELNTVAQMNQNSGHEYHIIDIQSYQYNIYKLFYRCLQLEHYGTNIYCLNEKSQIFKFNNTSFQFDLIPQQPSSQIKVSIQIISEDCIMIKYSTKQFTIFQLSSFQESNFIDIISHPFKVIYFEIILKLNYYFQLKKIIAVDDLIGVQIQKEIKVYQIISQKSQNLQIQKIFEKQSNKMIEQFVLIKSKTAYQLIYSIDQNSLIFDLKQNIQLGIMQNASQRLQKIIEDNKYIYFIGIANFILYDKNTFQKINYFKVNQFLFSKINKIIYLESDYFIILLKNGIQLIKLSLKNNQLIQTFSNLNIPNIFHIDKIYKQEQLFQVIIYGNTDANLFKLSVNLIESQTNSKQISLEVKQKETQILSNQYHYYLQLEVYKQKKLVGQYIMSFDQQQQQLRDIPIYYDQIFTNQTQLQIQSETNSQINTLRTLVIKDDVFSQLRFTTVIFFNIELYIIPTQKMLLLNQFQNIQKIIFDKVYLKFLNETQSLVISNSFVLIWQEVILQNQILSRKQIPLYIQDISQIKIDQLIINNLNTLSPQDTLVFLNIDNIKINKIIIKNSTFSSNILKFQNCSNILINQIVITDTSIQNGSIFYFTNIDKLIVQAFNANNYKNIFTNLANKFYIDIDDEDEDGGVDDNQKIYFFKIEGCFDCNFYNFKIESYQNIGIIKSLDLSNMKNPSFNTFILMQNIQINNSTFNKNYEFLYLIAFQIKLEDFMILESNFNANSIYLQPKEQGIVQNSLFKMINLSIGSIFYIQDGGDVLIRNSTFQMISSQVTATISSLQTQSLMIKESNFLDISCNSTNNQTECLGGSLNLRQINKILIIANLFQNSSSQDNGGAIYIANQNNYIVQINDTIFNNCRVNVGSGGAIYIQQSLNISIQNSTFENNSALFEKGGALALYFSNLLFLNNSTFTNNQAQIGGAIWYGHSNQTFLQDQLQFKNNYFSQNKGFFYGEDIGSYPIKIERISSNLQQQNTNIIDDIPSGNLIDQEIYFTFIDEQNKALNFTSYQQYPQSLAVQSEMNNYFLQIEKGYNENVVIKQGQILQKQNRLGIFQLLISSSYKINKEQSIQIQSNPLNNSKQITYILILKFRNCLKGEIYQSNDDGFIECKQCQDGKYSLELPQEENMNSLTCLPCPPEAIKCFQDTIVLKDGYWRQTNLSDEIYQCQSKGCSESQSEGFKQCLAGYIGPLCDSCDGSKQIWGNQYGKQGKYCLLCKEMKYQYIYFSVILISYAIYLLLCMQDLVKQNILIIKLILLKKINVLYTSKSIYQGETITLWMKIFIHYLQIFSLVFSFQINQPFEISTPIQSFGDPSSLTITSLDCLILTNQSYPIWLHRLVIQIINLTIQFIIVVLLYRLLYIQTNYKKFMKSKLQKICLKTSLVLFYLFYQPSISKLVLSGLFCRQIAGKYYLIQDLSQQCYTKSHIIIIFSIVLPFCLLWCFIIPLFIYRKLALLQQHIDKIKYIEQRIVYSVFYQGYKYQCFNWEIIKILQKFALMILINSNLSEIIKITFIVIILLLYTIYLSFKKPHQNKKLMYCEQIMMSILNFNFIFLLMIMPSSHPPNYLIILAYCVIIFCTFVSIGIFIHLSTNSLVIRLNDENTITSKFKRGIFKLSKMCPFLLRFLKFRQIDYYKINSYWKLLKNSIHQNQQNIANVNQCVNLGSQSYKNIFTSKHNLKQTQLSQDQQNYVFSSEQIDEKVGAKIDSNKEINSQVIVGINSQKCISLRPFNKFLN